VRAQRLSAPGRERQNCEEHGYPLNLGHGRTIRSGTPSHFACLGVRRLRGVVLNIKDREVPRVEARVWTRGRTSR
jgi:hypothetical protein